jgi:hypothetical protein
MAFFYQSPIKHPAFLGGAKSHELCPTGFVKSNHASKQKRLVPNVPSGSGGELKEVPKVSS